MKIRDILIVAFLSGETMNLQAQVQLQTSPITGGVSEIRIHDDPHDMNWLQRTDGQQYQWITQRYAWGLGYVTVTANGQSRKLAWEKPETQNADGTLVTYRIGKGLTLKVVREQDGDDILEHYTFTNNAPHAIAISETGIYTPFNDNYPSAQLCVTQRAHAHIWAGESASYVCALRMGATAPHLGLMLTEGQVANYEIWERSLNKANSQTRGLIALTLPDTTLQAGQTYTLSWRLFEHRGKTDFQQKLLQKGGVVVSSPRYVYQCGETAHVTLSSAHRLKGCKATLNGKPLKVKRKGSTYEVSMPLTSEGDARIDFTYDNGKQTHALLLVTPRFLSLLDKRVEFIRTHQQMNNPQDERHGAYMVFDNEGDSIYLNRTPNCNPVDRDEGAERIGMGLLLARRYLQTHDPQIKESLLRYVAFVREKLQTPDYVTYSSVDHKGRNRAYNYMWTASLFFYAYKITGDPHHASDGYETLRAMYRQFGHGFYAIEIPVTLSLECLQKAEMTDERNQLLADFRQTGDTFIHNGLDYPAHEVNYEQSIVAPCATFLAQLYLETKEQKYLDELRRQLPLVEAFNGFQPSYHLHDIAIRHWDGYWFGKREMFGDTFPHYWSCVTASVFHLYAQITGDPTYQHRAENIVRGNLCLFDKEGNGSCAYLHPKRINGVEAQFYDPYANDQDFALYFFLGVEDKQNK